MLFFLAFFAAPGVSGAAPGDGKPYFFASRDACYASTIFRKWECDNAFTNAAAQVRERAPTFAAKFECQLRFQLCQRRIDPAPDAEAGETLRYGPELLGVEILQTPGGAMTSPVLAVANPPGMFRPLPVARLASVAPAAQEPEKPKGSILPADRFLPLSAVEIRRGWTPFGRAAPGDAPKSTSFAKDESDDLKSRMERRQRLRSAPFVE